MRDFGGDLLAMCNRCAEDEARLALARLLDDLAASRRDQTILAHCLFDILGHELACADVKMVKVGVCNTGLAVIFEMYPASMRSFTLAS